MEKLFLLGKFHLDTLAVLLTNLTRTASGESLWGSRSKKDRLLKTQ
jgi:hypothetical protein